MITNNRLEVCTVDVHLHWITKGAYMVSVNGDKEDAEWIPRSQCNDVYEEDSIGKNVELEIVEWLAKDRGFI